MSTPKFITLTDTDGNKDRVNADHITWYTANRKGGSRVLLIDHDSANYYAETPEQIDAMLGVTQPVDIAAAVMKAMDASDERIDDMGEEYCAGFDAAHAIFYQRVSGAIAAATGTGEA